MKKDKKNPIAKTVKSTRKGLGLSQEELAKRAGVGLKSVRSVEQGYLNINLSTLVKILDLLSLELVLERKGGVIK